MDGIVLPDDTSADWAKLAAYIDGEGYICLRGGRSHSQRLQLRIGNTDPRLTAWAMERFGGTVRRATPHKSAKRIYWEWRVNGREAASILEKCLPHFVMKRDQAEIAIAFGRLLGWKIGQSEGGQGSHHPRLPEDVLIQRKLLVMKLREVRENSAERIA